MTLQVSDVIRKLEEDLCTCSVCFELLEDAKLLRCSHVFCKNCIEKLIKTIRRNKKSITCPICRSEYILAKGSKDIQSAHLIKQIIEFRDSVNDRLVSHHQQPSSQPPKKSMLCSRCSANTHECFLCLDCSSIRCSQCQCCPSKKHHVLNITDTPRATRKRLVALVRVDEANTSKSSERVDTVICVGCFKEQAYFISLHTSVSLALCRECSRSHSELNDVKCNWIPCHRLRNSTIRSILVDSLDKCKYFPPRYNNYLQAEGGCTFCVGYGTERATWMCFDCMLPCCQQCLRVSHYGWGISLNWDTVFALLGCRHSGYGRIYERPAPLWRETCSSCGSTQSPGTSICLDCGEVFCFNCAALHHRDACLHLVSIVYRKRRAFKRILGIYRVVCICSWFFIFICDRSINLLNVHKVVYKHRVLKTILKMLLNVIPDILFTVGGPLLFLYSVGYEPKSCNDK